MLSATIILLLMLCLELDDIVMNWNKDLLQKVCIQTLSSREEMLCIYYKYEILLCSLEYFFVFDNITSSVQKCYQKYVKLFTGFLRVCRSKEFNRVIDWLKHSLQAIVVYVKYFSMFENDHKRLGLSVICSIDYWLWHTNRKFKWYEVSGSEMGYRYYIWVT